MIEFDADKDARNLARHGISLAAGETLLAGFVVERIDDHRDYGETRIIAVGEIDGREFVCVYTRRGGAIRVNSLRPAKRKKRDVYREARAANS